MPLLRTLTTQPLTCERVASKAQRDSSFGKSTSLLCVMVTEAGTMGDSQRKEYQDSVALLSSARSFITCISCAPLPWPSIWLIPTQYPQEGSRPSRRVCSEHKKVDIKIHDLLPLLPTSATHASWRGCTGLRIQSLEPDAWVHHFTGIVT